MTWLLQANALLALLAAGLWGAGDFAGGMSAKSAGGSMAAALRVILIAHSLSLCVLLGTDFLLGNPMPHGAPLYWGLGAGLSAGTSLVIFYMALSTGAMGTSAALSGLLTAAIPALVSIGIEGRPPWRHVLGFLIAGAAIWLIAAGDEVESDGTTWMAIVSGAGFGLYFVALKFAGDGGIVWAMTSSRMGSLSVCLAITLGTMVFAKNREPLKLTRSAVGWAVATAALDTSGNLMFVAATRAGRLDVSAVLASLYPALTILLAAWHLHERPTRRQGLGMAVAVGAVILITL